MIERRPDLGAEMGERADRNHIVVLAAHIEVQEIVRLQAKLRIGLHIDLERHDRIC